MTKRPDWEIINGDALKVISSYSPGTFDAVITDPPYASGGRTQAEKNKPTSKKYSSMGENAPPVPWTSGPGPTGPPSGSPPPAAFPDRERRCACSSTGGSFPP